MGNFNTVSTSFREIAATSGALDHQTGIVVCIPSFRRPQHLALTLDSLSRQRTELRFTVVVVENDADKRESLAVTERFFRAGKIKGLCVVERRQGNCRAINAAFETALATFPSANMFLMIDDDEIASPDWLERMVHSAEITGADVVGGPVLPNFDNASKRGLSRHPAFRPAYDSSGPVPIIYGSGNCLITRRVFTTLAKPAFDLQFNFLGGGDTDFFVRCRQTGMKFQWVADATISETVPHGRTRLGWLAMRGLRIGAINYHIEVKAARTTLSRFKLAAKLLALLPLSLVRASALAVTERKAVIGLHPLAVAVGSALAAVGVELQPYKASKIAS
jgi:GT2 family glycosyltransferase